MFRSAGRILFPWLSAWAVFAYIHLVQCLFAWDVLGSGWLLAPLFLVIPLAELPITRYYYLHYPPGGRRGGRGRILLSFCGNMALWAVAYGIWAVLVQRMIQGNPGMRWYGPDFLYMSVTLWRSLTWMAVLAFLLWLGFYYLAAVRLGRLRILSAVVPYFVFTALFFAFQYSFGGMGGFHDAEVGRQPGVEKIYGIEELKAALDADPEKRKRVLRPPEQGFATEEPVRAVNNARGIWLDDAGENLFLFFGGTYYRGFAYPGVVKKHLSTGKIEFLLTDSNVRDAHVSGGGIYLGQWHDPFLYELSTADLSIVRSIEDQILLPYYLWEPCAILRDEARPMLYVGTDLYPSLFGYNTDTGKLEHVLDLSYMGLVSEAGVLFSLSQSKKTGMLYGVVCPGPVDVIEVDPEAFVVRRSLDLGEYMSLCLLLDDENGKLYFQSGTTDSLYKIDIKSFAVERIYDAEYHARALALDGKRKVMYVLGYSSGTAFALDLESGKRLWEIWAGGRPHGMILKGDSLYIHSMAGAFRVDLPAIWREKGFAGSSYDLQAADSLPPGNRAGGRGGETPAAAGSD